MFRGCLGNFYGRFTRGDVLQRSDARTHARAQGVQVRLTDDLRDVYDCLRDVSSLLHVPSKLLFTFDSSRAAVLRR